MSRTGLNLAFLRSRATARESEPGSGAGGGLSRRQLFRLAGAAAVAAQLLRPEAARALPNSVQFVQSRGRAAFKLNGAERWVIDTRSFGGSPRLAVQQTRDQIRLELSGATFPGTNLPADMVCEADLNNSIQFTFALGNLTAKAPLAAWLAGEAAATGRASLARGNCALGEIGRLTLAGMAKGQFFPDWGFRLEGSAIAALAMEGRDDLVSDSVSISLLATGQPSLLANSADRRTLISLGRRDRTWDLEIAQLAPSGWQIEAADHPFDLLHIETSLSRRGEVRRAMAAEASTDEGRLNLVALKGLKNTDGTPFRMPMTAVRYARTFDQQGEQTALIGRFGAEPVWLHAEGCSLQLGDDPAAPGIEFVRRNGLATRTVCSPTLLGLTSPMADTIVETRFGPGSRLVALTSPNQETQLPPISEIIDQKPTIREIREIGELPIIVAPLKLTLSVLRPEDLLVLNFTFANLRLEVGADRPARLVRVAQNQAAYIIVQFPPQAIGEQAFYETETPGSPGDETPSMPPVKNRISGPSQLVFRLPPGLNEVPYSIDALLGWTQYDHALVPSALPPTLLLPLKQKASLLRLSIFDLDDDCNCEPLTPAMIPPPRIQAPEEYHTAIEAPYRVFLSPNKYAGWAHSLQPVTHDGWTELWHTRLGVKGAHNTVDEESAYLRTVRAIWSPDFSPSGPANLPDSSPFRMSLTTSWRNQIVRLSSDYQIKGFSPKPIQAERLMLSALGAWLNVRGFWGTRPAGFTVEEWRHRAVMGRDTYVRVVEPGYLFPYGHRAALITVTERKFQPTPAGHMAAYLRQRKFIVVRQPERSFPAAGQAYSGRQMPLKKVTVTTTVTPALDLPTPIVPGSGESSFWPRVGAKDFLFNVITVDGEGQSQEYSTPMAFIKDDIAGDAAKMAVVANNLATGDAARRQRDLRGQKVAFAPATKPGDTSFEAAYMTFAGEIPDQSAALGADQPRFFPAMAEAGIKMAHVEALTQSSSPAKIKMAKAFLEDAFAAANKTGVFAELVDQVKAKFPANMSGGVGTPNLGVSGLSKTLGPVGGALSDIVGGTFDPKKFFNDEAKILGGILLSDIISLLHLTESDQKDAKVPQITARVVYPEGPDGKENKDAVPLGVETKLVWRPTVKDDPLHIFVTNGNTRFELFARLFQDFDGHPPKYEVRGLLEDFKVDLIAPVTSFLVLKFNKITFTASDGAKTDVDPKIDKVDFVGPLKFVQTLQDFLKSDGGGGPFSFSLDVTPSGVNAGVSLAIPSVQLGVLSIANMKLSMALNLPFNGDPVRLRFAFCERENPFTITVSMFGGGGFFAVALGLDGIELMEASFEFGGNFSMDIGVASGGAHIMVGIYYKMEGDDASLTGYLRLGGHLSVLGIITISAEFNMSLTYDIPNDKVWGQATLTVKIEILFFSMSVDLHVERKFKGSAGDPTFKDLMEQSDWDSYAEAFA